MTTTREDDAVSVIYAAARCGHLDVVQMLHGFGAQIHAPATDGSTPLLAASKQGHVEVVRWLMANGCDVHTADKKGRTATWLAASTGELDVVELLTDGTGANIDQIDKGGVSCCQIAAQHGHAEMVALLHGWGADVHAVDERGRNALWCACEHGHLDVCRMLWEYGAEILVDDEGLSPVWAAATGGHLPIVRQLNEWGADLQSAQGLGPRLRRPLVQAYLNDDLAMVDCLRGFGARLPSEPMDVALLRVDDLVAWFRATEIHTTEEGLAKIVDRMDSQRVDGEALFNVASPTNLTKVLDLWEQPEWAEMWYALLKHHAALQRDRASAAEHGTRERKVRTMLAELCQDRTLVRDEIAQLETALHEAYFRATALRGNSRRSDEHGGGTEVPPRIAASSLVTKLETRYAELVEMAERERVRIMDMFPLVGKKYAALSERFKALEMIALMDPDEDEDEGGDQQAQRGGGDTSGGGGGASESARKRPSPFVEAKPSAGPKRLVGAAPPSNLGYDGDEENLFEQHMREQEHKRRIHRINHAKRAQPLTYFSWAQRSPDDDRLALLDDVGDKAGEDGKESSADVRDASPLSEAVGVPLSLMEERVAHLGVVASAVSPLFQYYIRQLVDRVNGAFNAQSLGLPTELFPLPLRDERDELCVNPSDISTRVVTGSGGSGGESGSDGGDGKCGERVRLHHRFGPIKTAGRAMASAAQVKSDMQDEDEEVCDMYPSRIYPPRPEPDADSNAGGGQSPPLQTPTDTSSEAHEDGVSVSEADYVTDFLRCELAAQDPLALAVAFEVLNGTGNASNPGLRVCGAQNPLLDDSLEWQYRTSCTLKVMVCYPSTEKEFFASGMLGTPWIAFDPTMAGRDLMMVEVRLALLDFVILARALEGYQCVMKSTAEHGGGGAAQLLKSPAFLEQGARVPKRLLPKVSQETADRRGRGEGARAVAIVDRAEACGGGGDSGGAGAPTPKDVRAPSERQARGEDVETAMAVPVRERGTPSLDAGEQLALVNGPGGEGGAGVDDVPGERADLRTIVALRLELAVAAKQIEARDEEARIRNELLRQQQEEIAERDARLEALKFDLSESVARVKVLEAGVVNRRIYCRCGAEEFAEGLREVR